MATRLYLTASASQSLVTGPSSGVRLLSGTKAAAVSSFTMASPSYASTAAWVTTPLASAWTPTGALTFCAGMSGGGDVDFWLYAVVGTSTLATGPAMPYVTAAVDATPGSAQGWMPPSGMNLQDSTTVPAGYRLVFYVGNYTGTNTVYYGGTGGTDLTLTNVNVTTQPGWIEFADTISFAAEGSVGGAAQRGMLAMF